MHQDHVALGSPTSASPKSTRKTSRLNHPVAKILIVDDAAENIALLEMLLSHAGNGNVVSLTDPRLAEETVRKNDFDLLILDIRMPHMDGFDIMRQLERDIRDDFLPVLVLSGGMDSQTKNRALEAGARDFVHKPFDRVEVLNRINNILEIRALYIAQKRQAENLEIQVRERTLELQTRNQELESARLDIIHHLGRAAEYRDNETGTHGMRMSEGCRSLALAAGLGEAFAECILNASPMHDIGKIGIPDAILLKPGKLDAAEWEIMKTHAAIGGDILRDFNSDLMRMAHTIALTHHEKWDGSGYPRGLSGEDIPIEGRISDVFDALTSARPYKKAWPVEEAAAFIADQAGRHFDPRLAQLFLDILPAILEIHARYADKD